MPGPDAYRLMVVEDDPVLRAALVHLLTQARFNVVATSDGIEALEVFSTAPAGIDLILTDVHMPRLDGVGLLRRVRALSAQVPVILMSAREVPATLGLCGRTRFLMKPARVDLLLSSIHELLDDVQRATQV
ncbi:MAG TPA: response regulator [Longimicrobium sp.]|jgi:DNA-binding response OmpR family regulator